eukprot:499484-Prorocentrum_minimum.AAC.1
MSEQANGDLLRNTISIIILFSFGLRQSPAPVHFTSRQLTWIARISKLTANDETPVPGNPALRCIHMLGHFIGRSDSSM